MKVITQPTDGTYLDATGTMYPSYLRVVTGERGFSEATTTFYGYVASGTARLRCEGLDIRASSGTFLCCPTEISVEANGLVVVIARLGFRGLTSMGRIEEDGRLTYMNGCSSTILVAPPRLGDPILNYMRFPAGTVQAEHTHPSIRFGIVARGSGLARGGNASGDERWEITLNPGAVFLVASHERHAFSTAKGQTMEVVSFHPDSDWGPQDHQHPMLTRTYLTPR